jgi:glycyl-tRNA synthetase
MENSGKDLRYTDPKTNEKYIPHVIEPTFGLSRLTGTVIMDAYREEEVKGDKRIYLKFAPAVAPIKVAVFPLQKDEKLREMAKPVYQQIKSSYVSEFDDNGNIGKMYRRQDEIGTPLCVTIDFTSLEDHSVTVRNRDTMKQERIPTASLMNYIRETLGI